MAQQPNYEELAKQFGGTVEPAPTVPDYSVLAQQAGGVLEKPPSPAQPLRDFAQAAGQDIAGVAPLLKNLLSIPQTKPEAWQTAKDAMARGDQASAQAAVRRAMGDTDQPFLSKLGDAIIQSHWDELKKGMAASDAGHHTAAWAHGMAALVPIVGPQISTAIQDWWSGKESGGTAAGHIFSAVAPLVTPKWSPPTPRMLPSNPASRAAVQWAAQENLPMSVGQATGNVFMRGAQRYAGESMFGSLAKEGIDQGQDIRYAAKGQQLAGRTGVAEPTTRVQAANEALAGVTSKRNVMREGAKEHYSDADMYAALAEPTFVPTPEDLTPARQARAEHSLGRQVTVEEVQELRRILAEMEEFGYEGHRWRKAEPGESNVPSGQHVLLPGHAGAKVYDDIVDAIETKSKVDPETGKAVTYQAPEPPTRGEVIASLKRAIATGHFTGSAKGAMEVVTKRMEPGSYAAAAAELPPGAGALPPTAMQVPATVKGIKDQLRQDYQERLSVIRSAQKEADPALQAMIEFMEGPDDLPVMQLEQIASTLRRQSRGGKAIKDPNALRTRSQALANRMLSMIEPVIEEATGTVPGLRESLEAGRRGWAEMMPVEATRQALDKRKSAMARYRSMVDADDASIEVLRNVQRDAPETLPKIARAKLDQVIDLAIKENKPETAQRIWNKVGPETRKLLFDPGHASDLDNFFQVLVDRKKHVNPSGTAMQLPKGGELVLLLTSPQTQVPISLGVGAISAVMHNPRLAKLLVTGFTIPRADRVSMLTWSRMVQDEINKLPPDEQQELAGQAAGAR